jgi:hypothetical protein
VASQAVNKTVVVSETAAFDELEAQPLIKTMRPGIVFKSTDLSDLRSDLWFCFLLTACCSLPIYKHGRDRKAQPWRALTRSSTNIQ